MCSVYYWYIQEVNCLNKEQCSLTSQVSELQSELRSLQRMIDNHNEFVSRQHGTAAADNRRCHDNDQCRCTTILAWTR